MEAHEHRDSSLYGVINSSMPMRKAPHLCLITTAGFNLSSFCYEMRTNRIRDLEENNPDNRNLVIIYELDNEEEWDDETKWIKANPSLGKIVNEDFIKVKVNEAISRPSELVNCKTKHLNIWCASRHTWIPDFKIKKVINNIDWNIFNKNTKVYCGVDLSKNSDLTALSWLIVDKGIYYFGVKYYIPQNTIDTSINKNLYRSWVHNKYLNPIPGDVMTYHKLVEDIVKLNERFKLVRIDYDTMWSNTFVELLREVKLDNKLQAYSQSKMNFTIPTNEMENSLVSQCKCQIEDNPITNWCFQNVYINEDHNGNRKPEKEDDKSESKIDGVIAMLMALGGYYLDPKIENKVYI